MSGAAKQTAAAMATVVKDAIKEALSARHSERLDAGALCTNLESKLTGAITEAVTSRFDEKIGAVADKVDVLQGQATDLHTQVTQARAAAETAAQASTQASHVRPESLRAMRERLHDPCYSLPLTGQEGTLGADMAEAVKCVTVFGDEIRGHMATELRTYIRNESKYVLEPPDLTKAFVKVLEAGGLVQETDVLERRNSEGYSGEIWDWRAELALTLSNGNAKNQLVQKLNALRRDCSSEDLNKHIMYVAFDFALGEKPAATAEGVQRQLNMIGLEVEATPEGDADGQAGAVAAGPFLPQCKFFGDFQQADVLQPSGCTETRCTFQYFSNSVKVDANDLRKLATDDTERSVYVPMLVVITNRVFVIDGATLSWNCMFFVAEVLRTKLKAKASEHGPAVSHKHIWWGKATPIDEMGDATKRMKNFMMDDIKCPTGWAPLIAKRKTTPVDCDVPNDKQPNKKRKKLERRKFAFS
mmetsp:Transcript_50445/g.83592  ORF Transcript_50445/g.83592 Transcript_50445/m.83592 type:complete len:472 (+) Transcript_50445:77-1492(+)